MSQSTQNSSFIPKHSPATKPRSSKKDSPALFTIISSTIFGAVLIASAALLAYEWYLGTQFDRAVLDLSQASENFSQADLVRVVEFDARLTEANDLFMEHVSINRVLEELARQTVNSVQYTRVNLERTNRATLTLEADVAADELGSVLVQRNVYAGGQLFDTVAFDDVALNFVRPNESDQTTEFVNNFVGVTLNIEVAADSVLYDGSRNLFIESAPTVNVSDEANSQSLELNDDITSDNTDV